MTRKACCSQAFRTAGLLQREEGLAPSRTPATQSRYTFTSFLTVLAAVSAVQIQLHFYALRRGETREAEGAALRGRRKILLTSTAARRKIKMEKYLKRQTKNGITEAETL